MVSSTVAIWSSRMRGRRTATVPAPPAPRPTSTRTACAAAAGCHRCRPRPPALSICTLASWREMSAAVAPSACSLSGSSRICTSRSTPPTRLTAPTPRTDSSSLATSLSTNQDSASSSILSERHGVGQHRAARQLDLVDDRLAQVARQIAAHLGHGGAHVVQRFLRALLQPELGGDGDHAVLHLGVDVLQALQRGQAVFDLARHVVFELVRRRAGQAWPRW